MALGRTLTLQLERLDIDMAETYGTVLYFLSEVLYVDQVVGCYGMNLWFAAEPQISSRGQPTLKSTIAVVARANIVKDGWLNHISCLE